MDSSERLDLLATSNGVIAALAMDQRKSLRRMIANAASHSPNDICDAKLTEFKSAVAEILTYVYRANAETPPEFDWSKP